MKGACGRNRTGARKNHLESQRESADSRQREGKGDEGQGEEGPRGNERSRKTKVGRARR